MSSEAGIANEIDLVVNAWWDKHQSPVLLSKLGSLLLPETQQLVRDGKMGLKRFIALYNPSMRLLEMGRHGGGVAPAEKAAGKSEDDLERAFENQRRLETVDRIPSYDSLVWRAFRAPIVAGERRFLKVDPGEKIELREVESSAAFPDNGTYLEIKPSDLSHLDGELPPTARDIHDAIMKWAEGRTDLRNLTKSSDTRAPVANVQFKGAPRSSALDSLIFGLRGFTREELARISIPADVLLSMLERSRKER